MPKKSADIVEQGEGTRGKNMEKSEHERERERERR
jgi:hypothetical protein